MRKLLLVWLLFCFGISANAQKPRTPSSPIPGREKVIEQPSPPVPTDPSFIHNRLEQPVTFAGKDGSIVKFLEKNLGFPAALLDSFKNKQFRNNFGAQKIAFAQFVVDTLGHVSNITIANEPELHPLLTAEVRRVIGKTDGLWKPGRIGGKPVKAYNPLPIVFTAPKNE